ncbi:hypothetical protein BU23DRAFT_570413 [Bimuria novae-zelandiae CBS 107.79]|uniref:Uncharacterized protein n=1 Tax=Bimuria novae-zelandiae CBS 107.79 TaxID=1447943 RepID=A0A6A5UZY7_9PLEO|nr:hypothetical protein BU23DRAFT_570413 [Bimuria novae-zelandiae CBS 107.79]
MQLTMSKYLAYVLTTLFALVQLTVANFDLYQVHGVLATGPWPGTEIKGWKVVNDDPRCDQIDLNAGWRSAGDLSHGRRDIRCEGKCGINDPPWPDVKLVEMHFTNNPLWHFTIYKGRGYNVDGTWRMGLLGTDNKQYGECFAYEGHAFSCKYPDVHIQLDGQRKFRCFAQINANDINNAYKNEKPADGEQSD